MQGAISPCSFQLAFAATALVMTTFLKLQLSHHSHPYKRYSSIRVQGFTRPNAFEQKQIRENSITTL
jgi:hypothetical protein